MAGHGIKVTYQPFSLQERMAPLQMMKEEYDKVNEGLAELGLTANQMSQYIDPASQAGQKVAAYNKALDDAATTLSAEGLKGMSRTTLFNLKRAYQREIAPINEGAKNYAALQAQIKEMQWKDPTVMVDGMPTLDEYIANPNALPNVISGAQLMQAGATAALTMPNVTYEQLSRYMNGDRTAIPDLDKAAQSIAKNYGVSTDQALAYIQRGIQSGLGERTTKWEMAKQEADYEHSLKMELERYEQQQQNARHYSDLAYKNAALDFSMAASGWYRDAKGNIVTNADSQKAAREAYLSSQGYPSDTPRPWSTSSSRSSSGTKGTLENDRGSSHSIGFTTNGQKAEGTTSQGSPLYYNDGTSLQSKVGMLRCMGIDVSGAVDEYNSKRNKTVYSEDAIDKLLEENRHKLRYYRFYETSDGTVWADYLDKEIPISDVDIQIDSVHPSSSQQFGVTRRQ